MCEFFSMSIDTHAHSHTRAHTHTHVHTLAHIRTSPAPGQAGVARRARLVWHRKLRGLSGGGGGGGGGGGALFANRNTQAGVLALGVLAPVANSSVRSDFSLRQIRYQSMGSNSLCV